MSTVLIGYRGSGKTTIGRRLADRLWQPFVDIDDLIVQRAGKSIKEIFEQEGEPHFRDLETAVIGDVSKLQEHVIGLGGGSLGREQNRDLLRSAGHRIIYLRCDANELTRRIQEDPNSDSTRPSLTSLGGGLEEVCQMLSQREPIYRQVMHAELDVTSLSPDEAVVYIVRMM
jgi:shikimate kinase